MNEADLEQFAAMIDAASELLSGGKYRPNDLSTGMFFEAMAGYSIDRVREALNAHVARSQFAPRPADLLEILGSMDGRPGAEEAWAIALGASDENATVVWTPEIAHAWGAARTLMEARDKVGARMAFRECYEAAIAAARARRTPVRWDAAVGLDRARVGEALQVAAAAGRRVHGPGAAEMAALPPPSGPLLLPAPDPSVDSPAKVAALEGMARLAEQLSRRVEADEPESATPEELAQYVAAMPPIPMPFQRRV